MVFVCSLLNKLSPENFEKLSLELIQHVDVKSPTVFKGTIILVRLSVCMSVHLLMLYTCMILWCWHPFQIFDKALDEPNYSSMYAQLCSRLHTYNPKSDINKDKQNTVSISM